MSKVDAQENLNEVAIIGMAGRFPGAKNIDEFWRNLCDGVMSITSFSDEELLSSGVDPELLRNPQYVKAGATLEDIKSFDAAFFGFSPREAEITDPQQRLFLEVAWEAFENAGYAPKTYAGSIGVYAGASISNYLLSNLHTHLDPARSVDALQMLIGNDKDYLATHLSYKLNLNGPSVSVQSACSTSLVAVHLACQGLLNHECDMALVGAVSARVPQKAGYLYQEGGIFSSDGYVRAFDARASGTLFGSGVGVVVLKRLRDALDDGDNIYAVIKGSAINNDGSLKVGYTAPSIDGQAAVIAEALAVAEVDPETITCIEAHGTGTALGDPIEVAALTDVFRASTTKKGFCALGSVKTNVGHLETAAGIVGLIKTALALKHQQIPPSLNFEQPNPEIDFANSPFYVNTRLTEWRRQGGPRRAGVSSFGIGGTNAHVVLEEAPTPPEIGVADPVEQPYLLPLSARSGPALHNLAQEYRALLDQPAVAPLADLCYNAGVRRTHHEHRLALVGASAPELVRQLDAYLSNTASADYYCGQAPGSDSMRVVFVFPGQGAQYIGMGRELFAHETAFRKAIQECDIAIRACTGWSLIELLYAEQARLDEVDVVQPVLFAMQVALAAQWRAWGVEPDAVIGHSMGEIAAACVAGALRLEDAARVVCGRSQLLRQVRGQGGMLVAMLNKEEAQEVVAAYEGRLSVAAYNGPRTTVLSGEVEALEEVLKQLQKEEIFCRRVQVDYASHCQQMEQLKTQVEETLHGIQGQRGSVPLYSTVTKEVSWGEELNGQYWAENLRCPVQFWPMIERLAEEGYRTFVEISPHPLLSGDVRQVVAGNGGLVIGTLRRQEGERRQLCRMSGALYSAGYEMLWARLYGNGRYVELPGYPWQHEQYWLEPAAESLRAPLPCRSTTQPSLTTHPLLGTHASLAGEPAAESWEGELSATDPAYLAEHRLQGLPVLPASAYIELALAAAREAGLQTWRLLAGRFGHVLFLPHEGTRRVQVVLRATGSAQRRWEVYSRGADEEEWTWHADGVLELEEQPSATPTPEVGWLAAQQELCREDIPVATQYAKLRACGLEYGPSFRGMARLWRGDGQALGQLEAPPDIAADLEAYILHPALLDAALQLISVLIRPEEAGESPYVPVGIEEIQVYQQPIGELWAAARRRSQPEAGTGTVVADLEVRDGQGQCVLSITGLRVQRLETRPQPETTDWWYRLMWQRQEQLPTESTPRGRWLLLADELGVGDLLSKKLSAVGAQVSLVRVGPHYRQLGPNEFEVNPLQPENFAQLVASAGQEGWQGIVHLWSLGTQPTQWTLSALEAVHERSWGSLLHLVQAVAATRERPRLWVVTSGAQQVNGLPRRVAVEQAGIWGLGRTILQEHPELDCTLVDIEAGEPDGIEELWTELWKGEPGEEVAWRGRERYVARLAQGKHEEVEEAGEQAFGVEIGEVGRLDSVRLRARLRQEPGAGEVTIEVVAAGLNFLDVLQGMGMYPSLAPGDPVHLGGECAGRVRAVGAGVERVRVGQAVIAMASGTLGSDVLTSADFVVPKPNALSFAQAATLPLAWMTAWYALVDLARLQAGERILIHSAASGTGLAALLLAQQRGAQIYATAGSEAKRAYLRDLGVEHVFDSRSLAFVPAIQAATEGQGVDVILNSLSGEAMRLSLGLLAPYGRFVEIGKRDTYADTMVGLYGFRRNGSYYVVDLAALARERPDRFGRLLGEVVAGYEREEVKALPVKMYSIEQAGTAMLELAQGKHHGKIGLLVENRERARIARQRRTTDELVRAEGSYVITGGFGGLGLIISQWLVSKGAHAVALVGRHEPNTQARLVMAELQQQGARVLALVADMSREEEVERMIGTVERELGQVRGVVHAVGELEDATLRRQQWMKFEQVWRGKGAGAWHLYQALREREIDWVILCGSAAGLLGSAGQGNYAAVNGFLDGLARYWGKQVVSIDWGPWAQVGLAAAQENRGKRLQGEGLESLNPEEGLQALETVLLSGESQVGVLRLETKRLKGWGRKVWEKLGEGKAGGGTVRKSVLEAPTAERRTMLEQHVREQAGQVLRLDSYRVDIHTPLHTLGLESLMALELRNRLAASLGLKLPATVIWSYPTIAALAEHLAKEMGVPLEEPKQSERLTLQKERETLSKALATIEELSEDEALQSLLGGKEESRRR